MEGTWRIIPGFGSVLNNHGDRFRPLRIGLWDGTLPSMVSVMAEINGWVILTTSPEMILQVRDVALRLFPVKEHEIHLWGFHGILGFFCLISI